jgi:hypothetical protein
MTSCHQYNLLNFQYILYVAADALRVCPMASGFGFADHVIIIIIIICIIL